MPKVSSLQRDLPDEALTAIEALGAKIRAARIERHLSQQEVADYLGISKKTYISIEQGKPSVQLGKYALAIWYLDAKTDFLSIPYEREPGPTRTLP